MNESMYAGATYWRRNSRSCVIWLSRTRTNSHQNRFFGPIQLFLIQFLSVSLFDRLETGHLRRGLKCVCYGGLSSEFDELLSF